MAHPAESNWQRLPLTGAYNVRDLGGYPVGMRQTKWHAFLRGDKLHDMTDEDCDFVYRYGVRTVIDLRSEAETKRDPDRVCNEGGIAYVRASLSDEDPEDPAIIKKLSEVVAEGNFTPKDIYVYYLENKSSIRTIFRAMAQAPENTAILFHCSDGKDRAGIISMLLLMLAGVSRTDCIADYMASYPYCLGTEAGRKQWEEVPEAVRNLKDQMLTTLGGFTYDWIEKHGGARKFLEDDCGISAAELDRVVARLV